MKDLKLGIGILATTTCYLDNEVFKLHPTTLTDAYESSSKHIKGLQIKLGLLIEQDKSKSKLSPPYKFKDENRQKEFVPTWLISSPTVFIWSYKERAGRMKSVISLML